MQRFINQMSRNGMHLQRMGKFKCIFSENASIRFIYALCGEGGATLYTQSTDWEHFLTYKNVMFFRKAVPNDAVRIERKFGKNQLALERNWLSARLAEGLYMIGKVDNEYIFARSEEYRDYEYQIKKPQKVKKNKKATSDPSDTLKDIKGLKFVTVSSDNEAYYFLKDAKIKNRILENRGKRLSDQLLAAFVSVLSVIGFGAFAALTVYGVIKDSTLLTVLGAIGLFVTFISFIVFYRRSQKIAELRRIRAEENRARMQAEQKPDKASENPKSEPANSNTVVMNTVVLNKYDGSKKKKRGAETYDEGINSMGQIFDATDNPALDPNVNPALAASKDPIKLANAFMDEDETDDEPQTIYVNDPIYDSEAFGKSKPYSSKKSKPITVVEPIEETDDTDDDYTDEYSDDGYENGSPIVPFLLYGLAILIGIGLAALGIYLITAFFTGSGNSLFIVLALLCLLFSPFIARFGILNCQRVIYENSDSYTPEDELPYKQLFL